MALEKVKAKAVQRAAKKRESDAPKASADDRPRAVRLRSRFHCKPRFGYGKAFDYIMSRRLRGLE